MPTNPVQMSVERASASSTQFTLRIYDVSVSPKREVAHSETYVERAGADNAAHAIRVGTTIYEAFLGTNSRWYWHVKSTNGQILVWTNFSYGTKGEAEVRMKWLRSYAAGAAIS